jgi:hypothetical protein
MKRRRKRQPSSAKFADDPTEPMRCHAARKHDGNRCRQYSEPDQMVCRYHGGKGSGAPLKHGKFSYALGRFGERYDAALEDETSLFSLHDTLAIMHVAAERAAERLAERDSSDFRERALELMELSVSADAADSGRHLIALRKLLREGAAEDEAMTDLIDIAERFAARKEKALDLMLKSKHAMPRRELILLLSGVCDIMVEEGGKEIAKRVTQRISVELLGESLGA